jgi:hypothetical protein
MPYRKKGQKDKLLDLAKKSRARAQEKRATKKRLKDQVARNMAAGSKTPAQRAAARKKTTPTAVASRKPHRTDAQRAAAKKKLLAEQGTARAAGNKKSLTRFIPQMSVKGAEKVGSGLRLGGEALLTGAALAGSGGAAAPALGATRGGRLVLGGLGKAKSGLSKLFKRKPSTARTAKPSTTTTPAKPSGRGPASGGKKPSGPGSRTARRNQRQTAQQKRRTQSQKDRTAARKKRETAAERRERLDSGGVRMGINRRDAGLARGRNTMRNRRRRN